MQHQFEQRLDHIKKELNDHGVMLEAVRRDGKLWAYLRIGENGVKGFRELRRAVGDARKMVKLRNSGQSEAQDRPEITPLWDELDGKEAALLPALDGDNQAILQTQAEKGQPAGNGGQTDDIRAALKEKYREIKLLREQIGLDRGRQPLSRPHEAPPESRWTSVVRQLKRRLGRVPIGDENDVVDITVHRVRHWSDQELQEMFGKGIIVEGSHRDGSIEISNVRRAVAIFWRDKLHHDRNRALKAKINPYFRIEYKDMYPRPVVKKNFAVEEFRASGWQTQVVIGARA